MAEGVRRRIQAILQARAGAPYVFISARRVLPRLPPVHYGYVDRYLAANPIPGWLFYGMAYHGKRGNKGKHYVYVREGCEKLAEQVARAWCKRRAGDLLEGWRVPVRTAVAVRGRA
jgi:hypothetical protein